MTIHTNLYGDDAFDTIKNLRILCKDNSCSHTYSMFHEIEVVREPDGEIVIRKNPNETWRFNSIPHSLNIFKRTQDKALKWFAHYIRKLALEGLNNDVSRWTITSTEMISRIVMLDKSKVNINVPVNSAFFIYYMFLGHNISKIPKDFVERFVGKPRDPITTEIIIAKNKEIQDLKQQEADAIEENKCAERAASTIIQRKCQEDMSKVYSKFKKLEDDIVKEFQAKIAEVESRYSQMIC